MTKRIIIAIITLLIIVGTIFACFYYSNSTYNNNENTIDNIDNSKEQFDINTRDYIMNLSNENIEKIMGWDFSEKKMVSLNWLSELPYEKIENYNPNGYFSNDGESFVSVDDSGNESLFKYANISFNPPLTSTIKTCSGFGYENCTGLLVTNDGELYIGYLAGPEEIDADFFELDIIFNKYTTTKKAIALDKNVIKYNDGSFGYLDCSLNYKELRQTTALPFEDMYDIVELNSENLSDELLYRLLNGSYVVESIKNIEGNVSNLNDINISNINYLICGSLSVYGFDNPFNGLLLEYIDLNGNKEKECALYNNYSFNDEISGKAKVDVEKNTIDISSTSLLKKVIYNFEFDGENITNKTLFIYTHDGHVIKAKYDKSVEELRSQYESVNDGKYVDLFEIASYGANYYEYFRTDISVEYLEEMYNEKALIKDSLVKNEEYILKSAHNAYSTDDYFEYWGTSWRYGGGITFNDNDEFFYSIGIWENDLNRSGKYIIDVDQNKIIYSFKNGEVLEGDYKLENGEVTEVTYIESKEENSVYVTLRKRTEDEKKTDNIRKSFSGKWTLENYYRDGAYLYAVSSEFNAGELWIHDFRFPANDNIVIAETNSGIYRVDTEQQKISFDIVNKEYKTPTKEELKNASSFFYYTLDENNNVNKITYVENEGTDDEVKLVYKKY